MFGAKHFDEVVIQRGAWTWRVRPELEERIDELERAVLDPASRRGAKKVKETGGRRAIWTQELAEAGFPLVFVKHYSRPRFLKQLKHLLRNSRTRQEWEMGRRLEELGLPAARHLAMAERRERGLLQEDYLIEEALVGHQNFDAWFREKWEGVTAGPEVAGRREAISRLADLIRRMHDHGALQRDFKPDSIMVSAEGDYRMVDLERALILPWPGGLPRWLRLDNLAKIDQTCGFIASTTDRLRFLRAYFRDAALPDKKIHEYAAEISHSAELKFRKRARERRVWSAEDNVTYRQFRARGFRISAHRDLPPSVIQSVLDRAGSLRGDERFGPDTSWRELSLRGVWCDAQTALAHAPSLYYRHAPFVPARAAFYPGAGPWGLLLYLDPCPPLMTWRAGADQAKKEGRESDFARDLGRSLRVFHRMGLTYRDYLDDTFLYDPAHPNPWLRFYLNRLEFLLLDRSPSPREAEALLSRISDALAFAPEARVRLAASYHQTRLRWFRAPDRW